MKILYRYILREAFTFFGVALFAFTAILLTLRMLQFAALIVDKGVELSQIAQVFIAIIPTFLQIAIPLASLLGVLLAFSRFSGDSEVVVMRTSGVSLYQIMLPIILFGIISTTLGLYVSHQLKPWGYRKLAQTLFEIARTKSTSGLDDGVFNKLGALTLYAEEIDHATGAIRRVVVDDRRERDQRKIVVAQNGSIISDDRNRTIILELYNGDIHEIVQGKYALTHFIRNRLTFGADEIFDPDSKRSGRQTNELLYSELIGSRDYYDQLLNLASQDGAIQPTNYPQPIPAWIAPEIMTPDAIRRKIVRLGLELGQRYSLPFASFALALLGLPLGIQPPRTQRTWGAGISATLGMGVFVFYYALFSTGIVLAQSGMVNPDVALWLPNVSVFLVAVYLLRQIATERWQSVAHAIDSLFGRLRHLFSRHAIS